MGEEMEFFIQDRDLSPISVKMLRSARHAVAWIPSLVTPYQLEMVRQMLLESCSPDWGFMQRLTEDLNQKLDEDAVLLTEKLELRYWVRSTL